MVRTGEATVGPLLLVLPLSLEPNLAVSMELGGDGLHLGVAGDELGRRYPLGDTSPDFLCFSLRLGSVLTLLLL